MVIPAIFQRARVRKTAAEERPGPTVWAMANFTVASTKTFVDNPFTHVHRSSPTHPRGAFDPPGPLATRQKHGPRRAGGAQPRPARRRRRRLHHRPEAHADHDRQGPRPPGRVAAHPRLRGQSFRGAHPAPPGQGPARPRLRRLGAEARPAGALCKKSLAAGDRPDPLPAGRTGKGKAMSAINPLTDPTLQGLIYRLGWVLVHSLWEGAAVALLLSGALLGLR